MKPLLIALDELRQRTVRANQLAKESEVLDRCSGFGRLEDCDGGLLKRVWDAGKAAILTEIESGLREVLNTPPPSPPPDGWEPIEECDKAVALFFGEGSDGNQLPAAIFPSESLAEDFLRGYKLLPEDDQHNDPHLMPVRRLSAEFWNSSRDVDYAEPTADPFA